MVCGGRQDILNCTGLCGRGEGGLVDKLKFGDGIAPITSTGGIVAA